MLEMSTEPNVGAPHGTHVQGLRAVALVEAAKGVLALAVAFALIALLRKDLDLQEYALHFLGVIHIAPDRRIAGALLDAAGKVMDWNWVTIAGITLVYSSLRFVEAYGLWRVRIWAEWLAIISGSIYIPMEVYELIERATPVRWTLLFINILVVLYIAWVRWDEIRGKREGAVHQRVSFVSKHGNITSDAR